MNSFLRFFYLFLCLGFQTLKSQPIEVAVMDAETGESLPGATITTTTQDQGVVTDAEGKAQLEINFPTTLTINFVGYQEKMLRLNQHQENLLVYLQPDTKLLNEVVVIGYENNRRLLESAGAISLLNFREIHRFNETSILPAMNTIPGVRMEQRSPGSYRINIRGSSLRSPFDVRNVKVYWNGVPFTDPSGITSLNLLDLKQVDKIEVIRGPAASIFGAGTGGVVNLQTAAPALGEDEVTGGLMFGSFGLQRYEASYSSGNEDFRYKANVSHQQTDGYREHTAFRRSAFQLFGQSNPSDRRTITGNLFYSDLFYEVPGGLTSEQFDENPRQARPSGFFPGSVEQNSSLSNQAVFASLKQDYEFSDRWENSTSVYGTYSFFEMPFITDFEREARQAGGFRTIFHHNTQIGQVDTRLTFGTEHQRQLLVGRNFGNRGGIADTINFDDEVRSWQLLSFLQAEFSLPAGFLLNAGISLNDLEYDIYRLTDAEMDTSYRIVKQFDAVWAPRIALSKQLGEYVGLHASVSRGFSPPSVNEVRTGDGGINRNLQSELGINYEAGIRGSILNSRLNFDLVAFYFQLQETIVSFTDSESNVVRFRNTGATDQRGLELSASYQLLQDPGALLNNLLLKASFTRHNFRFDEYIQQENNFSGNMLTGVPPYVMVLSLDWNTKPGIYGNFTYNFTDEIPLNDGNTVYADAFHLFTLRTGYLGKIGNVTFDLFAGVENLFDITYSLGNDLNAFGRRFFQTAPGRNYFTGIQFKL